MVRALTRTKNGIFAAALCGVFAAAAFAQQQDPPSRVARLSYTTGNVSMEPAGVDDWAPADVNHPFTIGDYLYTDQSGYAALTTDVAVMRMGPNTSFGFLNLDDQTVQLKLTEGSMYFHIRNFSSGQVFEVDTPNAAIQLLQNGVYRVDVDGNNNTSDVVVREGQAQVTGGGQAFTISSGQSANLSGTDQLSYDIEGVPQADQFDDWDAQRDQQRARYQSSRYLPPTVIGYEDMDQYGGWQSVGQYGPVWYPNDVPSGWAPYSTGYWSWVAPWGYTWVDSSPWGFAPYHYGRWVYYGNRWGWAPGPMYVGYGGPVVRPWYAPALVAFFGGSGWGVSIGIGGGGASLGWVPLGWGDVYTPPYVVSAGYFQNVNVYNTRVTNVNITNVYNTVYVNHAVYNQQIANMRVPNAVRAMPATAFASGRAVAQVARPVPAAQIARIQPTARVIAPPVAPTRQAVMPTLGTRPAPHPPAQVLQRQVVAKARPPAPPPSFAARDAYLKQHVGQPLNEAAIRKAVPAPRTTAAVRVAPAAHPVPVHTGARVGNPPPTPAAARMRPGTAPAARGGQPAARPGQPTARPGERAPAPAAHGTPPNRPGATPAERGQPAARTTPGARPETSTAPENRAAPATRPAPAGHGTPPNMRGTTPAERNQPAARTAPGARPETRTAPENRATPATRPAPENRAAPARPAPENRAAPATRPAPENRSTTARPETRTTRPAPEARPAPARPAPEARQPAARPEARPAPARPAPETRPAPATRQESRPARPETPTRSEHGTPPKNTRTDTKH